MNAMTDLTNLRVPLPSITARGISRRQLDLEYDPENRVLWTFMKPAGTPCFNLGLLNELRANDKLFETNGGQVDIDGTLYPVDFSVGASRITNVFNYGGDLALFVLLIKSRDRDALLHYARLCVDTLYGRLTSFDTNVVTISLLQGDALGGGFESALASHVLIAEDTARMGFPEILFNLFPGMGAYSLLSRRVGAKKAEEIILSGKIYSAQEMFDLGLIDVIVPAGRGEAAVNDYVRRNSKRSNGLRAMFECRRHTQPISYEELMGITEVWVDAALRLQDKDLKMMGRLVRSQLRQQEARRNGMPMVEEDLELALG
ncbi:DSF synthase [Actimicrobium sp. GrIS 1.19]|uniref:crotonase/enoyl-CoA hydratase family protein n=1 Tax=Actimicrobium sp. GrIS 1.19 TaxID=3071708 RepID=UPI002DFBA8D2|nr:DSF synthase [Actimicrobium sp. GrIS 1.19]